MKNNQTLPARRAMCASLMLLTTLGLSACGNKDKQPGQALASVNGEEITVLQLNEEMQRSGVQAGQQQAASKQLLEALIDRQLLENAAVKDKVDRDPAVMQAVERAKALIIAQAYMQKAVGVPAKPRNEEIADYFDRHPAFFKERKQFDMRELAIASRDMSDALKAAIDGAKSLDEVAAWLAAHQVTFTPSQLSRTSADLPPEMSAKLLSMPKGQLFIIREGERVLIVTLSDVKDASVTLETAMPQIGQFLVNKRNKDAADAEIARLRAVAKVEYLNKPAPAPPAAPVSTPVSAPARAGESTERGVAGLH